MCTPEYILDVVLQIVIGHTSAATCYGWINLVQIYAHIITGNTETKVTIQQPEGDTFTAQVGKDVNHAWNVSKASSTTLKAEDNVKNYENFWKSVKIRFYNPVNRQSKESYINYITSNSNAQTITMDNIAKVFPEGNNLEGYIMIQAIS